MPPIFHMHYKNAVAAVVAILPRVPGFPLDAVAFDNSYALGDDTSGANPPARTTNTLDVSAITSGGGAQYFELRTDILVYPSRGSNIQVGVFKSSSARLLYGCDTGRIIRNGNGNYASGVPAAYEGDIIVARLYPTYVEFYFNNELVYTQNESVWDDGTYDGFSDSLNSNNHYAVMDARYHLNNCPLDNATVVYGQSQALSIGAISSTRNINLDADGALYFEAQMTLTNHGSSSSGGYIGVQSTVNGTTLSFTFDNNRVFLGASTQFTGGNPSVGEIHKVRVYADRAEFYINTSLVHTEYGSYGDGNWKFWGYYDNAANSHSLDHARYVYSE